MICKCCGKTELVKDPNRELCYQCTGDDPPTILNCDIQPTHKLACAVVKALSDKPDGLKLPCHFVVLGEKFQILLKGHINEQRNVRLSFRWNAPGDHQVSESYSGFDCILALIPPGTLPTIQLSSLER